MLGPHLKSKAHRSSSSAKGIANTPPTSSTPLLLLLLLVLAPHLLQLLLLGSSHLHVPCLVLLLLAEQPLLLLGRDLPVRHHCRRLPLRWWLQVLTVSLLPLFLLIGIGAQAAYLVFTGTAAKWWARARAAMGTAR